MFRLQNIITKVNFWYSKLNNRQICNSVKCTTRSFYSRNIFNDNKFKNSNNFKKFSSNLGKNYNNNITNKFNVVLPMAIIKCEKYNKNFLLLMLNDKKTDINQISKLSETISSYLENINRQLKNINIDSVTPFPYVNSTKIPKNEETMKKSQSTVVDKLNIENYDTVKSEELVHLLDIETSRSEKPKKVDELSATRMPSDINEVIFQSYIDEENEEFDEFNITKSDIENFNAGKPFNLTTNNTSESLKRLQNDAFLVTSKNMKKDNLTAVLHGINDLRLEQRPIPKISDTEVLVEMDCVGICGSDVHFLVEGRIGHYIVKKPMIIGHEASGVIAEAGKKVKNVKVGDRVAIEPNVPCRKCAFCKYGSYNLCPTVKFCATPPDDGTLTKFFPIESDFCFKLPAHVTMEEGALMEPLAVAVYACRRANIGLGSEVLILGAGPIGLVHLLVAKSMGATNIVITDLVQSRLDMAQRLGANCTILLEKGMKEKTIVKNIHNYMPSKPDKTMDCVGVEMSNRLAIYATRPGGTIVLVGLGPGEKKLPISHALINEIDIRGSFQYANAYPGALALVESGAVDAKPLITHHFDITETEKAFETARCGYDNAIKVMIHCQPRDKNNP